MSGRSPLNPLTIRQENICTYGGVFGVLVTLTCLIQHLAVTNPQHWAAKLIVPAYIFILLSFLLLAFQKIVALVFLIISAVFALGIELVWLLDASFSLVVLILLMYHVVMIVVLFAEQIPAKLKQKRKAILEEEMKWADKI
jgi:hypothetical protein